MSTRKGLISILIGVFTSIIGTAFQFTLMYLLIKSYGSELNGFVKNTTAIVAFLGGVEGGLGAFTVIFLLKPLMQKDWIKANEILNTAKRQYRISGYIGLIILLAIGIGYSTYTFLLEQNFSVLVDNKTTSYALWKMLLIILTIGSKNLLALFWTACYENLMQADQNNHMRRLILMISDLLAYALIFYLISLQVDPVYVFLIFFSYSLIKGVLIYLYVKFHYPWIRIYRQRDNKQLVKASNAPVLKNIGETLLINGDIIIIALLLGLRISSTLSLYMTITVGVRSVMMILINSFKEFFASWTAKNGRINWNSYLKFETYAFMIGGFLFVNQFILSPYFINALYAPQILSQLSTWTSQEVYIFQEIFYQPTFSLLVALTSVFIVLGEPANVLVYAKANYKQTGMPIFILGLINIVFSLVTVIFFRFAVNDSLSALYSVLIITCVVSFMRFIYLWIYNWLYLTYNSSFKGVFQNWMILLIPIVIAILVNYLQLTKEYNPMNIYTQTDTGLVVVNWGWSKLVPIFFGLIFISLFVIILNSIIWAPQSVKGILLRLPIVYRLWLKRQEKMRKQRQQEYEDDFITLTEPVDPYKKTWEREENLQQTQKNIVINKEPEKEVYKLKGT